MLHARELARRADPAEAALIRTFERRQRSLVREAVRSDERRQQGNTTRARPRSAIVPPLEGWLEKQADFHLFGAFNKR